MKYLLVLSILVMAVSCQPVSADLGEGKTGKTITIRLPSQWAPGPDGRLPDADIAKLLPYADIGDLVLFTKGLNTASITLVPGGWSVADPIPQNILDELGVEPGQVNKFGFSIGIGIEW